jgi:hypothetical protein
MTRRYHVRWRLLLFLIALLVVLPLVLWLTTGIDISPFVVAWVLVVLVGAGGAGLRMLAGRWYREDPTEIARRETDRKFERPRDERGLL